MIRRPPRSTQGVSSAASDVYKRQRIEQLAVEHVRGVLNLRRTRGSPDFREAGEQQEERGGGTDVVDQDHDMLHRGGASSAQIPAASSLEFVVASGRQGAVFSDVAGGYRVPTTSTARVRLHDTRRPLGYVRVWRVLNALHAHLFERRTVTQRALYYLLASRDPTMFSSPEVVNGTLRECVSLLQCSRHAMVGRRCLV